MKELIGSIVIALNPSAGQSLNEQLDELIEFEKNLDIVRILYFIFSWRNFLIKFLSKYKKQFGIFKKNYRKHFKNTTSGFTKSPKLLETISYVSSSHHISSIVEIIKSIENFQITYLDLLEPYPFSSLLQVDEEAIGIDFNIKFQDFLNKTPKRLKLTINWLI